MYNLGGDVVIAGHDHLYERHAPVNTDQRRDDAKGIRQFTVGTGGAPLYSRVRAGAQLRDPDLELRRAAPEARPRALRVAVHGHERQRARSWPERLSLNRSQISDRADFRSENRSAMNPQSHLRSEIRNLCPTCPQSSNSTGATTPSVRCSRRRWRRCCPAATRCSCCRPAAASRCASRRPPIASDGLAIVVSPLISLMKDQVDTLVGNGVRGGLLQQLDAVGAEERGRARRARRAVIDCCTSRPSGWSATAATASSTCCRRGRSASSPSTKRIASASGDTTSVRSIASSRGCAIAGRPSACTPTPRPRPRASAATSSRSSGCAMPTELVGSFDRPNLVYRVLARSSLKTQMLDVLERHRGQAGIIYCSSRKEVDAIGAVAAGHRLARAAVSRRHGGRGAASQPGCVPERRDRSGRRDGGVRDGHRSIGRALRDPRRRAAVARALSAGIGPRRPRRARSRVRADRVGRGLPEVAR